MRKDILDNRDFVSKLDTSNMLRLISELPEQCKAGYETGKGFTLLDSKHLTGLTTVGLKGDIRNIVFAGVGGSAIGADIVRMYLHNEINIPIVVCRNYTLPSFVGRETLLFCASYSGNTEETLSAFEDGCKKNANIITMGSGGRLKDLAKDKGFKHILVPCGLPPRIAIGYMSITVLAVLEKLGFIQDKTNEVAELYSSLVKLRDNDISIDVPLDKNISKQLAYKLYKRYCIVYGTSDSTEAVAIRWRGQLAENSKSLSSHHIFPEMNHNEIVGWEFPKQIFKDCSVIILYDKEKDHIRTQKRIDISKGIISKSGAEVIELHRQDKCFLARMFSLIYIGDFLSFYLAILNGVDPTPVKQVDYLKAQLAES